MKIKSFHRAGLLAALLFTLTVGQLHAQLPPDAQVAMQKGILAAKEQEWQIAIQSFQEARKTAPNAPEIFYNLGLAESKISGRELRAIAWFGAYLAANPTVPNAAAVNYFIAGLQIKSQGNLNRLIKTVQDAASGDDQHLIRVAGLWAEAGDVTLAFKTTDLILNPAYKSRAQSFIAQAQVRASDTSGAQKTFAIALQTASGQGDEQMHIAGAQAKSGDITGALRAADIIQDAFDKSLTLIDIAKTQTKTGDFAGAQKTLADALKIADLIHENAGAKTGALTRIAEVQTETGDLAGAKKTLASAIKTSDLQDAGMKPTYLIDIANAQAESGDIAGAIKTANLIQATWNAKDIALSYIAGNQAFWGDSIGAQKTANLIQDMKSRKDQIGRIETYSQLRWIGKFNRPTIVKAPIQPAISLIKVSDWVNKLDDNYTYGDCALNTDLFLDFASYLTSQHSDDPQKLFNALIETAEKIVRAKNIIDQMLKQQAKQQATK